MVSLPEPDHQRSLMQPQSFRFRSLHHSSHALFTWKVSRFNKLPIFMDPLEEFRQYLEGKRGSSDRTVRAYLTDVTMALSEMDSFETGHIEMYLSSLSGRGTARSTVARKLAALRAYGDYLSFKGSNRENPASRVAAPHRSFRVASDDYSRQRDRTLQEIARMTGLQITEMVALNAEASRSARPRACCGPTSLDAPEAPFSYRPPVIGSRCDWHMTSSIRPFKPETCPRAVRCRLSLDVYEMSEMTNVMVQHLPGRTQDSQRRLRKNV
jgi:hypothetical protein